MSSQEKQAIDAIRVLSMDAVQKAKSGHPGTAVALAPVTYLLYNEVMNYNPANPSWMNRDKFVLSIGHASMLLYATLHLAGVKGDKPVTIDDIKSFRQLDSRCAGHPEFGHTSGVEMTTGPLGAGVATSVGMALASKWYASRYNKPGFDLFGSRVYALCGDGDMMEGISSEAASLAGHLGLSNLCWIYDSNKITIEGDTALAFSESVRDRFTAYGWTVLEVDDVNDLPAMRRALGAAGGADRPTLIIVQSVIAYGAPTKAGKESAHGAPLGEEEILGAKKFYGYPEEPFFVDPQVYQTFADGLGARGARAESAWNELFASYRQAFPELAAELETIAAGGLPEGWEDKVQTFPADAKGLASRSSGGKVLNDLAAGIPWLVGGSADLAPSNNTWLKLPDAGECLPGQIGRNIHFGIRENAMAAITNGLVLCGLRAFCGTFFVFCDYLRPMIRLAALMKIPTLFVFTHDSIGVGEDGPTHQPVEHLAALRAIPNVHVFRPADANEVAECYKAAMKITDGPSVMILSRQNLPTIDRQRFGAADGAGRGGYVVFDSGPSPEILLIATGSEVSLCTQAAELLSAEGRAVRVVSVPCWELFAAQSQEYRDSVLPPQAKKRVGVEAAVGFGWERFLGRDGKFIGMSGFGASAPAGTLMKHFGLSAEAVAAAAKD
ncbi:MAG: transketolase [Thermoguttaceae bacterium]|nr:transketolase [Thermoguttaceae bacterium]